MKFTERQLRIMNEINPQLVRIVLLFKDHGLNLKVEITPIPFEQVGSVVKFPTKLRIIKNEGIKNE